MREAMHCPVQAQQMCWLMYHSCVAPPPKDLFAKIMVVEAIVSDKGQKEKKKGKKEMKEAVPTRRSERLRGLCINN